MRRKGKVSLKARFARAELTLEGTRCLLRETPTTAPQLPTCWQHSEFKCISEFCFLEIGTIRSLFSRALEKLKEVWVEEKKSMNSQAISSNTSASLGIKPTYLRVTWI